VAQTSNASISGSNWVAVFDDDGPGPIPPALWLAGGVVDTGSGHAIGIAKRLACPRICYPDCDGSSTLTVADFGCFQARFVAGDPYADCEQGGTLTVADFGCFQTRFVTGCR
jgi:hypothetical protein